ncbi:MAG: hypothetical protein WEE64_02475 [Dehalococcoidia bacterium]
MPHGAVEAQLAQEDRAAELSDDLLRRDDHSRGDGAYGGITPQLNVYMALYSEHNKPPESTLFVLDVAAKIAREQEPNPSNQWIREIEVEAIMSLDVARSLRDWLNARLAIAEELRSDPNTTFTTKGADTGDGNAEAS